ncbi:hypothetical protein JVU11DRAFT_11418 [Chiua virens]|nr:hypothetical protein JVU11DRAFT_11418 [Chiua virens]
MSSINPNSVSIREHHLRSSCAPCDGTFRRLDREPRANLPKELHQPPPVVIQPEGRFRSRTFCQPRTHSGNSRAFEPSYSRALPLQVQSRPIMWQGVVVK